MYQCCLISTAAISVSSDDVQLLATESGATSAAVKQEAVELWESRVRLVLPVAHLTAGDPLPPPLLSAALVSLPKKDVQYETDFDFQLEAL